MQLICNLCGHEFSVHSGHYWRHPDLVGNCPKCCGTGEPDEAGKKQIESRNKSVEED